jgi:hypothetical protein
MLSILSLFFMFFCAPANKSDIQSIKKYAVIDQAISTCNQKSYNDCVASKAGEMECARKYKCSANVLADVDNPNALAAQSPPLQPTTPLQSAYNANGKQYDIYGNIISPNTPAPNPVTDYSFGGYDVKGNIVTNNNIAPTAYNWNPSTGTFDSPSDASSSVTPNQNLTPAQLNNLGYATREQCAQTLENCLQNLGGVDACYSADSSIGRFQCDKNDGKYQTYLKIESDNAVSPNCILSTLRICLDDKGGDSCYTKGNKCKSYRLWGNK